MTSHETIADISVLFASNLATKINTSNRTNTHTSDILYQFLVDRLATLRSVAKSEPSQSIQETYQDILQLLQDQELKNSHDVIALETVKVYNKHAELVRSFLLTELNIITQLIGKDPYQFVTPTNENATSFKKVEKELVALYNKKQKDLSVALDIIKSYSTLQDDNDSLFINIVERFLRSVNIPDSNTHDDWATEKPLVKDVASVVDIRHVYRHLLNDTHADLSDPLKVAWFRKSFALLNPIAQKWKSAILLSKLQSPPDKISKKNIENIHQLLVNYIVKRNSISSVPNLKKPNLYNLMDELKKASGILSELETLHPHVNQTNITDTQDSLTSVSTQSSMQGLTLVPKNFLYPQSLLPADILLNTKPALKITEVKTGHPTPTNSSPQNSIETNTVTNHEENVSDNITSNVDASIGTYDTYDRNDHSYKHNEFQKNKETTIATHNINSTNINISSVLQKHDCPVCPTTAMSIQKKLQLKFDDRILQKACRQVYSYNDAMESFWSNRFKVAVEAVEAEVEKLVSDIKSISNEKKLDAKTYSETIQTRVLELGRMINRKYLRLGLDLYQFSFDLMTKELSAKLKYINFWKSRPNFEDIEDELEDKKARDMESIKARQQGGHIGEFVEGSSWRSFGGRNATTNTGSQTPYETHVKGVQVDPDNDLRKERKRTIDIYLGNENKKDLAYNKARTHTFGEFDALLQIQKELALRRMGELINQYNKTYVHTKEVTPFLLDENRQIMELEKVQTDNKFVTLTNKLSTIYSNEFSIMDIIFDTQFMTLYVLKLMNYGFFALALYLAEKLFSEMYMKNVYGNGSNPPDLLIYIGITLALNLAFVIFLLVVLFLVMYIFQNPNNNFIVDMQLISKFLIDYIITTVIVGLVGVICGSIIQKKRYFRYKTEGLRGVRALNELMLSLGALVFVVPYFYIVN